VQLLALAESTDRDIKAGNLDTFMTHIATYHGILYTLHGRGMCRDFRPMKSYLNNASLVSHPERGMKSDLGRVHADATRLAATLRVRYSTEVRPTQGPLQRAARILGRFHGMALQLKIRERCRSPLEINDEYDLQYVLKAALRLEFDDVRPEENTPSYAGRGSRMDLLLKSEQIVVETKFVTARLLDKEVGEQLVLDIAHYRTHPDCKTLVCYVYDPRSLLVNPAGLIADLEKPSGPLPVSVIVGR